MDESLDTQRLLVLRKLTRTISERLRAQMRDYVTTLAPLIRPKVILGNYIQGASGESGRNADFVFKSLHSRYEKVASAPPFKLDPELKPPIEIISTALEMTPYEYSYVARSDSGQKTVKITSPLKWSLNYSGFVYSKLRNMLSRRDRNSEEVRNHLIHALVIITVLTEQKGVTRILETLGLPILTEYAPEFGEMPLTFVSSNISTIRPPDRVIIESTEISGMDVFEEIIDVDDIKKMSNPLKDELVDLVRSQDPGLLE